MKKAFLSCLTAFALLSAAMPCAARAQEERNVADKDALVARLKDARAKDRRVTIKFKNGASVSGKVGELREKGFTFSPDGVDNEYVLRKQNALAGIFYEDITAVKHPSKVKKFFKNIGFGFLMAGAAVIIIPVIAVDEILGRKPDC
jgi:hypothetical protein